MTTTTSKALLTALLLGLGGFTLAACDEGPAEEAGEAVDEAIEDTGDAVEEATDEN